MARIIPIFIFIYLYRLHRDISKLGKHGASLGDSEIIVESVAHLQFKKFIRIRGSKDIKTVFNVISTQQLLFTKLIYFQKFEKTREEYSTLETVISKKLFRDSKFFFIAFDKKKVFFLKSKVSPPIKLHRTGSLKHSFFFLSLCLEIFDKKLYILSYFR